MLRLIWLLTVLLLVPPPPTVLSVEEIATPQVQELVNAYIGMHSAERLRAEKQRSGVPVRRTAVLGQYSCPMQAGNRLHSFMNAFAGAIITNRTFVWRYCTSSRMCPKHGSVQDCEKALHRKEWIPSFEEFGSDNIVVKVPGWPLHSKADCDDLDLNPIDHSIPVIDFGSANAYEIACLARPSASGILDQDSYARAKLLSIDVLSTFGILFYALFEFSEPVMHHVHQATSNSVIQNATTVALHSRHINPNDKGSDISREVKCLREIMKSRSSLGCVVFIMSDRRETVARVTQHILGELGCLALNSTPAHGGSFKEEHGPYSGIGTYQDLAFASQAGDGVVGVASSSITRLLRELVAQRAYQTGRRKVQFCGI